jgi:hypothetical protein
MGKKRVNALLTTFSKNSPSHHITFTAETLQLYCNNFKLFPVSHLFDPELRK